ncbi:MAG: NAD-dependent protein deacylase [Sarcina sp.]
MKNKIDQLIEILKESKNIVFFGGAGVSTESNIPDFRSSSGIFNQKLNITLTPEQLVSHSYYIKYPKEFFNFYKEKLVYPNAKPNKAHLALVELEKMGKLKAIITQNIDGLHQMASSKTVFELHGSIHRNYCTKCNKFYDLNFILNSPSIPLCTECNGIVKPDVVLYEEGLDNTVIDNSINAISKADTLIIGGTSLIVYPAAGLINYFNGKNIILINKSSTPADNKANLVINDSIGTVLDAAISLL